MNSEELRPCDICGNGHMADGAVTFHRVRFERYAVDLAAVRERHGLQLIWNNRAPAALVEAFATREDVAVLAYEPADLFICETCAAGESMTIATLAERAHEKLEKRKANGLLLAAANEGRT